MTRDEILNMPAGREMDALIAEKVMGISPKRYAGVFGSLVLDPEDGGIPCYSTDIKAAWEIVDKLQSKPQEYYFDLNKTPSIPFMETGKSHWHCEFGGSFSYADTAPLAICRAALLAVMELE